MLRIQSDHSRCSSAGRFWGQDFVSRELFLGKCIKHVGEAFELPLFSRKGHDALACDGQHRQPAVVPQLPSPSCTNAVAKQPSRG